MHSMVLFVCCFARTEMENKHNAFVYVVSLNPHATFYIMMSPTNVNIRSVVWGGE